MKRRLAVLLILSTIFTSALPVYGNANEPLDELAGSIEGLLFGSAVKGESINSRLSHIESVLFATNVTGSITDRFARVNKFLITNDEYGPSVVYKVNSLEWQVFRSIKRGPLTVRVQELERELYGKEQSGGLLKRVESLVVDVMPESRVPGAKLMVPEGTLIKVRLLTQLDSTSVKVGQEVLFEVAEPLVIEGNILVAAGSPGSAVVDGVRQPGRFGTNAKISFKSQQVSSVDGTLLPLKITEKSTSFNENQAIAIGLSAVGLTVLGPLGAATGAFIKGNEVFLPLGSEFYMEIPSSQEVVGIPVGA
jgi:hypothetical protein